MKKKLELTAFHHWLIKTSDGDTNKIAANLYNEVVLNKNPQAFDLLKETGDNEYNIFTFKKAAEILKSLTL